MATIKEKREFFLRNVQVSTGVNADKEIGFPVKETVGVLSKFNRFLKGNFPSEKVFAKVWQSVAFHLNQDSTATTDMQGLAKAATNQKVIDRDNSDSEQMCTFVRPYNLPIFVSDNNVTDTVIKTVTNGNIKIEVLSREGINGLMEVIKIVDTNYLQSSVTSQNLLYSKISPILLNATALYTVLDSLCISNEIIEPGTTENLVIYYGDEFQIDTVTVILANATERKLKLQLSSNDYLEYTAGTGGVINERVEYSCKINCIDETHISVKIHLTVYNASTGDFISEKSNYLDSVIVADLLSTSLCVKLYGTQVTTQKIQQVSFCVKQFKGVIKL